MFLLNILEAVLAYDLVKIRFIREKEVILNWNDKSRGIQLIGPGYLQKVIKGVNWLLSPIGVGGKLFSDLFFSVQRACLFIHVVLQCVQGLVIFIFG